jgi:hypothetical protein
MFFCPLLCPVTLRLQLPELFDVVAPTVVPFTLTVTVRFAVAVPVTVNELPVAVEPFDGEVIEIEVEADTETGKNASGALISKLVKIENSFFSIFVSL